MARELQDDHPIHLPRHVNEKEKFRELFVPTVLIIIGAPSSAYSFSRGETQVSKYPLSGKYSRYSYALLPLILFAAGCGGGYSAPPTPPAPSVTLSSSSVTFPAINQGASSAPMMVTVTNNGTGALTISSVAAGGSNPGDFTNTNTCTAAVSYLGTCTISVTFVPTATGPRSETITLTDNAPNSPQVINVTGTANPPSPLLSLRPSPPWASAKPSRSSATGDPAGVTWSVAGAPFLGSPSVITSPGTIDSNGNYTGPGGTSSFYVTVTATSKTDPTKSASATVNVVAPGAFTTTNNVQVAQYAVTPPSPANASVQFGLTTTYGLNTWTQPNSTLGSPVSLYVAGMKQSTPYHMQRPHPVRRRLLLHRRRLHLHHRRPSRRHIADHHRHHDHWNDSRRAASNRWIWRQHRRPRLTLSMVMTDLNGNVLWAYNPGICRRHRADPIKLLAQRTFPDQFLRGTAGRRELRSTGSRT